MVGVGMGWVPQFCRSEGGWLVIGQRAATWPPPAPAGKAAVRFPCKQASGPSALSTIGGHSGWGKGGTQSCPEGVLLEQGVLRGRDTSARNGLAGDVRTSAQGLNRRHRRDMACGQPASRGVPLTASLPSSLWPWQPRAGHSALALAPGPPRADPSPPLTAPRSSSCSTKQLLADILPFQPGASLQDTLSLLASREQVSSQASPQVLLAPPLALDPRDTRGEGRP